MRFVALAMLAGCYQPHADPSCALTCTPAIGCPDGVPCIAGRCGDGCAPADAKIDSPPNRDIDAPAGCFGEGDLIVCGVTMMPGMMEIESVDTNSQLACQLVTIGTTPACVIAAADVVLGGGSNTGGRMLVIIGNTITVPTGVRVDSSALGMQSGAGQRVCAAGTGASVGNSGSGGAGGAFVTAGGRGGAGPGTVASMSNAVAPTAFGGCAGGAGGGLDVGGGAGGGGAIALIATQRIQVDGTILACGGGGATGYEGGGGGGGSGGSIILIAPMVTGTNARLLAIGGGGGAGGDGTISGAPGEECDQSGVALGGATSSNGGNGGVGHSAGIYGGPGFAGSAAGGGGGGGGGAGRIEVRSSQGMLGNALIVPPL